MTPCRVTDDAAQRHHFTRKATIVESRDAVPRHGRRGTASQFQLDLPPLRTSCHRRSSPRPNRVDCADGIDATDRDDGTDDVDIADVTGVVMPLIPPVVLMSLMPLIARIAINGITGL